MYIHNFFKALVRLWEIDIICLNYLYRFLNDESIMKGYYAYHCDPELAILSPKPAFLHFPIMVENLQSLIFSNPKLLSLCV